MTLDETVAESQADAHKDEAYCPACNKSFSPETVSCPDDGAQLVKFKATRDELLGRVLDGRYEVRAPLGKGGMGTVYRAWQRSVDREVALKVVHPKLAADRQAAKRFLREARLASRLSQPNIVNVYDFGQSEDGVLYLVMELLKGKTLATELGTERRFSARRTATIGLQLCDALEAAHAQGTVHRDLKPGNVVILDEPVGRDLIKVLDFGLAKSLVADTTSQVTNTDAIIGTPLYMSPEQVQGRPSDQRADLYALGCILYELITGKPPFVDTSVNLVMARHLQEPPAALPAHVPLALARLVERLLAKDPAARVQTAREAREIIQRVIESGSLTGEDRSDTDIDLSKAAAMRETDVALAHASTSSQPAAVATPAPAQPAVSAPVEPRRPSRAPWILAGLLVAGGAGALIYTFARDRGPSTTTPVVAPTADAAPGSVAPVGPAAVFDAAPRPPAPADAAGPIRPPVDASTRRRRVDAAPIPPRKIDAAAVPTTTPPPRAKPDAAPAEPDVDIYPTRPK